MSRSRVTFCRDQFQEVPLRETLRSWSSGFPLSLSSGGSSVSAARNRDNPNPAPNWIPAIAVMVLVVAVSGWTGLRARATARDLAVTRRSWESTATQLATVQQQ